MVILNYREVVTDMIEKGNITFLDGGGGWRKPKTHPTKANPSRLVLTFHIGQKRCCIITHRFYHHFYINELVSIENQLRKMDEDDELGDLVKLTYL